jgi:hypothetical protein
MATPHVSGAAALYMQQNPNATPAQVATAMTNGASLNKITGVNGSPNRLLYWPFTAQTTSTSTRVTTGQQTQAPSTTGATQTGGGNGPCSAGCRNETGTLSGTGAYRYHPGGSYYSQTANTAQHRAWLTGPTGADFDLALYKWTGSQWQRVSVSESATSVESISYNGSPGYYTWRVYSYAGSGSYAISFLMS